MSRKKDTTMYLPRASLGRGFVPPRYSAGARRFMIIVGGWYLRIVEGVKTVNLRQPQILLDELERFYNGNHRLIIAFRHVAKEDAPVMMFALNKKLQRLIRKRNRTLKKRERIIPHAKFLYGRDVLNWAGKAAAWLFPRIGCVPVQNRGNNRSGLTILRREMREGTFPIALAPESQVTYHMYTCSSISSGISSLAAWGEESNKDVTIIPLAIGYRHDKDPETFIRSVMKRWEHQTGMSLALIDTQNILLLLHEAVGKTVGLLEELYHIEPDSQEATTESSIRTKILTVCETAMQQAEHLAQQEPEGNLLDRLFRIRYSGVEAIYPESFDPKALPPLGRSIADFHAMEAHVYLRHSQIVDVLQYVDPAYIAAPCSAGRACEFALNLLDVINRAQGGNINTRYSPMGKDALIDVGKAVRVSELLPSDKTVPRKARLDLITKEVHHALQTISEQMEAYWETSTFI
jgi:hypothetical protein